jgi:hypothetical protein
VHGEQLLEKSDTPSSVYTDDVSRPSTRRLQTSQSRPTGIQFVTTKIRQVRIGNVRILSDRFVSLCCFANRDRHGSSEHLWHGRHPRVGSILYDTQLDFVDFVTLFRSFSLLIRKDLRDLFEQLAISYRSMAVNTSTKVNGVKTKVELKKLQKLGLLTRNSRAELDGSVVNSQKKIFDAIAAASIFTNCAGIDTNNSQVITMSTFTKFLETRQMEVWTEEQVKALIHVSRSGEGRSVLRVVGRTCRDTNRTPP